MGRVGEVGLDTTAEEMGHILHRMSFSSIIRESQDLGAGLFDTDFNTLCESESTPLHKRIAEIPDGEYRAGGVLDDDGRNRDVRLPVQGVRAGQVRRHRDRLTGSADQVETGFNVPFEGSTKVACFAPSAMSGATTATEAASRSRPS